MRQKPVFILSVIILSGVLALLPAVFTRALAAEAVPGGSCAGIAANAFQWAGGPQNGGALNGMFCESNAWTGVINFQSGGNVGIGTATPATTLDVESGAANPVLIGTTYSDGPGGWTEFLRSAAPNLAAGEAYIMQFGTNFYGLNDSGYIGFVYNSAESATNFVTFGLDNPSADNVLNITGSARVGIKTTTPQATLDINGYLRLAKNSAQPAACSATNDGALALSHVYTLCICKGGSTSWVQSKDGTTACSW